MHKANRSLNVSWATGTKDVLRLLVPPSRPPKVSSQWQKLKLPSQGVIRTVRDGVGLPEDLLLMDVGEPDLTYSNDFT